MEIGNCSDEPVSLDKGCVISEHDGLLVDDDIQSSVTVCFNYIKVDSKDMSEDDIDCPV